MGKRQSLRTETGYTLVELMMTVLLVGILGSMAVFQIGAVRPGMLADGAMRSLMGQLNYARETAVSERRDIEIQCDTEHHLFRVIRHNLPTGTTVLSEVAFEGGVTFGLTDGATAPETGFGSTSAAAFGAATVFFTTDGSLVDSTGAPVNGAMYLRIPGVGGSSRAVTVMGSIGRVRGYRWNGSKWTRV